MLDFFLQVLKSVCSIQINNNQMQNQARKCKYNTGRWTRAEHDKFMLALEKYGWDWNKIQRKVKTRNLLQIRSHAQKVFLNMSETDVKAFIGSDSDQQFDTVLKNKKNLQKCSIAKGQEAKRRRSACTKKGKENQGNEFKCTGVVKKEENENMIEYAIEKAEQIKFQLSADNVTSENARLESIKLETNHNGLQIYGQQGLVYQNSYLQMENILAFYQVYESENIQFLVPKFRRL